ENKRINRAESATKAQRTSSLFLHLNCQVLAAGNATILRIGFDVGEVTEVLQTLFRNVYPNGVINIARRDEHLAPNYLILGPGVTNDVDALDKRPGSFFDLIVQIDNASTGRCSFRRDYQIYI